MEHNVATDHFGDVAFLQKLISELIELSDQVIIHIRPIKGLL